MPQLSPGYSLPPFKGEVVEREKLVKYPPPLRFFMLHSPQVHNDKACEKIQILSICPILFSGLNVEPLKEF
jgi:hypothetical protein